MGEQSSMINYNSCFLPQQYYFSNGKGCCGPCGKHWKNHFQVAFNNLPSPSQEPPSWKNRVVHFGLGVLELIPGVGAVISFFEEHFASSSAAAKPKKKYTIEELQKEWMDKISLGEVKVDDLPHQLQSPDFFRELIGKCPNLINSVLTTCADEKLIVIALKADCGLWEKLNDKWKWDKGLIREIVKGKNRDLLKVICKHSDFEKKLCGNREVVLKIAPIYHLVAGHLSDNLKQDGAFVKELLRANLSCWQICIDWDKFEKKEEILKDVAFWVDLIVQRYKGREEELSKYLPEEVRGNKEIFSKVVQQEGLSLYWATGELKQDQELVEAAVKNCKLACCCFDYKKDDVKLGQHELNLSNYGKSTQKIFNYIYEKELVVKMTYLTLVNQSNKNLQEKLKEFQKKETETGNS